MQKTRKNLENIVHRAAALPRPAHHLALTHQNQDESQQIDENLPTRHELQLKVDLVHAALLAHVHEKTLAEDHSKVKEENRQEDISQEAAHVLVALLANEHASNQRRSKTTRQGLHPKSCQPFWNPLTSPRSQSRWDSVKERSLMSEQKTGVVNTIAY